MEKEEKVMTLFDMLKPTEFDASEVYKAEILPKIEELENLLEKHKIPHVIHCICKQDKTGSQNTLFANNFDVTGLHSAFIAITGDLLDGDIDEAFVKMKKISAMMILFSGHEKADAEKSEKE